MISPINYVIDDKDLDDAALWAVIDSAAASLSSASNSRKPLAIKSTIPYQSPKLKFISPLPSPQIKSPRNHRISDGEVLQGDSNHLRPQKIARSCIASPTCKSPDTSPPSALVNQTYRTPNYMSPDTTDCPLAMVKHAYQTPTYMSPDTRASNVNQFSPIGSDCFPKSYNQCKEGEFPRHSLAGQFPSVSLFKDYQNAAMSVSLLFTLALYMLFCLLLLSPHKSTISTLYVFGLEIVEILLSSFHQITRSTSDFYC